MLYSIYTSPNPTLTPSLPYKSHTHMDATVWSGNEAKHDHTPARPALCHQHDHDKKDSLL